MSILWYKDIWFFFFFLHLSLYDWKETDMKYFHILCTYMYNYLYTLYTYIYIYITYMYIYNIQVKSLYFLSLFHSTSLHSHLSVELLAWQPFLRIISSGSSSEHFQHGWSLNVQANLKFDEHSLLIKTIENFHLIPMYLDDL